MKSGRKNVCQNELKDDEEEDEGTRNGGGMRVAGEAGGGGGGGGGGAIRFNENRNNEVDDMDSQRSLIQYEDDFRG